MPRAASYVAFKYVLEHYSFLTDRISRETNDQEQIIYNARVLDAHSPLRSTQFMAMISVLKKRKKKESF